MPQKTICHFLVEARKRDPSLVAVKTKRNGLWRDYSWQDYFRSCERVGLGLLHLGLKRGDRVAILSNTRCEWVYSDLGIMGVGGITVPIYQSNLAEEIKFILNNSQSKFLICEDYSQWQKWQLIRSECPSIEKVIVIAPDSCPEDTLSFSELMNLGESFKHQKENHFILECEKSMLSDTSTVLYTSGTTGLPKGVVLTHQQIMSEVKDTFDLMEITNKDSTLSFLPYAHILGRVELWGACYSSCALAFAESIERLRLNLTEIRPTVMIGVPRIFEKIYSGVLSQVEASPIRKKIFYWAMGIGKQVSKLKSEQKSIPLTLIGPYLLAKKLVFDPFNEKLGGRLRFAICGGAPLSKDIAEFFHAAGLLILEGYGLTETTAAVTINTPWDYKFGTVGKPLGDVQIKIADDGEILVRSHKVMKEYYENKEATNSVLIDGFFATGDIGEITKTGHLRITDRKKDLIKTAGGKYVAPQKLENLLKLNQYISNVLIHGDQKKFIVALVTLNKGPVFEYAKMNNINISAFEELVQHQKIKDLIRDAVAEANKQLASYESMKNFSILADDFTIENGLLTPSLKVKRKICDERFRSQIDSLYRTDSARA